MSSLYRLIKWALVISFLSSFSPPTPKTEAPNYKTPRGQMYLMVLKSVKIPNVPRYWWPQPPWWQLTEVGDPESVDWSLIIQSLSRV